MNIFTTSNDPVQCAINLDDKRVKHMPKECFEMISIALFLNTKQVYAPFIIWDIERRSKGDKIEELFRNKCTQWAASKRENIWWLYLHSIALMDEYKLRTGNTHYLFYKFIEIQHWIPRASNSPSNWPNASGYNNDTIFESYQECLVNKWFVTDEIKPVSWTKRSQPEWVNKYLYFESQGHLFNKHDEHGDIFGGDDDLPF